MNRYYKIMTGEIITTENEIPEHMFEKKGLKKYVEIRHEIDDREIMPVAYAEFTDKEYIFHRYVGIHYETLDEAKAAKKAEVKAYYLNVLTYQGFVCSNGIKIDCRESDKINWLTLKLNCISNPVNNIMIRDYNNQIHEITDSSVILTMLSELEGHYKDMLFWKWSTEEIINECTTKEELDEITWH